MILLRKADKGVEHAAKLKDGMADREGVHVDQQHLVVLQFEIFGVVVAMEHVVVMRHSLNEGEQLLSRFLRQIVLHKARPAQHRLLHIRQLSGGDDGGMDLFEYVHILFHAPVHLLRLGGQDLGEGAGVEQLEHGAVAVPHLHHVVGNGGWDAEDQRQLGHLALMLDIGQRVGVFIDLDDIILVDAVDLAVGAAADLLAALHRNLAVGLFHRHHLGKAGHIEDLIDLGIDVDDLQRRAAFFQPQDHAETGAGDILQVCRVQNDLLRISAGELGQDVLFHRGGIVGIDAAS